MHEGVLDCSFSLGKDFQKWRPCLRHFCCPAALKDIKGFRYGFSWPFHLPKSTCKYTHNFLICNSFINELLTLNHVNH